MKHRSYSLCWVPILLFAAGRTLPAQSARVAVDWNIGATCNTNIPVPALQQELIDQLRGESITVSRVHDAGLVAALDCQPIGASRISVQQCLSLTQAVADVSAANGLHLKTTWRSCQSSKCGRQNCGLLTSTAQHGLVTQFIPAFRSLLRSEAPATPPLPESQSTKVSSAVYAAAKPALKPDVVFYVAYILACLAVLARWEWCRYSNHATS